MSKPERTKPLGPAEVNRGRRRLTAEQRARISSLGGLGLWRKIRAGEPVGVAPKKKKRGRPITFKGMGKRGGKSRAATLTPERRKEIARQGGLARKRKFDQQRAAEREGQQGAA